MKVMHDRENQMLYVASRDKYELRQRSTFDLSVSGKTQSNKGLYSFPCEQLRSRIFLRVWFLAECPFVAVKQVWC